MVPNVNEINNCTILNFHHVAWNYNILISFSCWHLAVTQYERALLNNLFYFMMRINAFTADKLCFVDSKNERHIFGNRTVVRHFFVLLENPPKTDNVNWWSSTNNNITQCIGNTCNAVYLLDRKIHIPIYTKNWSQMSSVWYVFGTPRFSQ